VSSPEVPSSPVIPSRPQPRSDEGVPRNLLFLLWKICMSFYLTYSKSNNILTMAHREQVVRGL